MEHAGEMKGSVSLAGVLRGLVPRPVWKEGGRDWKSVKEYSTLAHLESKGAGLAGPVTREGGGAVFDSSPTQRHGGNMAKR